MRSLVRIALVAIALGGSVSGCTATYGAYGARPAYVQIGAPVYAYPYGYYDYVYSYPYGYPYPYATYYTAPAYVLRPPNLVQGGGYSYRPPPPRGSFAGALGRYRGR